MWVLKELNPDLLEKQLVLLTTEPSIQLPVDCLLRLLYAVGASLGQPGLTLLCHLLAHDLA